MKNPNTCVEEWERVRVGERYKKYKVLLINYILMEDEIGSSVNFSLENDCFLLKRDVNVDCKAKLNYPFIVSRQY